MRVVSNTSPIVALVNIDYADILKVLFDEVVIPQLVLDELRAANRPIAVREFAASPPDWLSVRNAQTNQSIPDLHPAETAAISLAIELPSDLLLIDEARGTRRAREIRLHVAGTIGVLEAAAGQDILNLAEAFDRIKQTDFWISRALLDDRLRLFQQSR